MKKIVFVLAMALALIGAQSCKDNGINLIYDVTVTGDADGVVDVAFPNGTLVLNGDADVNFHYGSLAAVDSTKVFGAAPEQTYALSEAVESEDAAIRTTANTLNEMFTVNATDGTYYVHFVGYVREPITGLQFNIDKELTNRANEAPAVEAE